MNIYTKKKMLKCTAKYTSMSWKTWRAVVRNMLWYKLGTFKLYRNKFIIAHKLDQWRVAVKRLTHCPQILEASARQLQIATFSLTTSARLQGRRRPPTDGLSLNYIFFLNRSNITRFLWKHIYLYGDCGSTVVKVLCYKSEGRWFDSRWCQWNFSLT